MPGFVNHRASGSGRPRRGLSRRRSCFSPCDRARPRRSPRCSGPSPQCPRDPRAGPERVATSENAPAAGRDEHEHEGLVHSHRHFHVTHSHNEMTGGSSTSAPPTSTSMTTRPCRTHTCRTVTSPARTPVRRTPTTRPADGAGPAAPGRFLVARIALGTTRPGSSGARRLRQRPSRQLAPPAAVSPLTCA